MKFLYSLFLTFLFSSIQFSQQDTSEFPIGVFVDSRIIYTSAGYDSLAASGVNYIVQEARQDSQSFTGAFNLIGSNSKSPLDVIYHYSNAVYSKWEAEREDPNNWVTGFKHTFGEKVNYLGKDCWTTGSQTTARDSLLYGPHYAQEKKYQRLNYRPFYDTTITYLARYNIAFKNPLNLPDTTQVCRLKVRYGINETETCTTDVSLYNYIDDFPDTILTVGHFPDTTFQTFTIRYQFPEYLLSDYSDFARGINYGQLDYMDNCPKTGVEFMLDCFGKGELFVDFVEVADSAIGDYFTTQTLRDYIIAEIDSYLVNYTSGWNNLQYWYVRDEPHWIDCYLPLKFIEQWIDSISSGRFHTITEFYPSWNGYKSGDIDINKYIEIAQPHKLMIDYYPFTTLTPVQTYLDLLRGRFQEASIADPEFWYVGQGFGQVTQSGDWCHWERPDSAELRASAMLALAHGAKGIMFWKMFTEEGYAPSGSNCNEPVKFLSILDPNLGSTDIYREIKNNLAPRLRGILGNTLKKLDYTGYSVQLKHEGPPPPGNPSNILYLTLNDGHLDQVNFLSGLLKDGTDSENNFFLLVNLITDAQRTVGVTMYKTGVPLNLGNYTNIRVREIENNWIDETFTTTTTFGIDLLPGEGRLFQVAPVIKYGGRLPYNDTVKTNGTELIDNMSVNNGVTLSIKKDVTYIVKDTITLEGTGFISGQGYLDLQYGDINTVSWSKSLFKGVSSNHPRLYLRKPDTESPPTAYTVYRKTGATEFTSLGNLSGTATEFTDSTIDISTVIPIIEYYLKASFSGFSVNTNIVRYDRTDGNTDSLYIPGGWQTVSVPVIMTDSSAMAVLGTSQVFKFAGGYQQVYTLDNGVGYWANFSSPDTIIFNGTPIDTLAMPVDSGWNLEGSLFYNTFVSQVRAVPDTTINTIYKYQNGYVPLGPDSILKPGIGYWIKTRNSGTVYMEANFGKITTVPNIDFASMDKFTIKDAEGNQQILYVTNTDLDTISIDADFEMPPYYSELPFDSRLEMNDLVKKVSAQAGPVDLNILVHTLSYPVTITWQLNPANGITYTFIGDSILGKIAHNLNGSGSEEINSLPTGKIRLTAIASGDYKPALPDKFDLLQNYPNPFNPSTKIKYSVPEETHINLTVYNILGQEVVKLKNEVQKPGYYEVTFDASSLSSGIYLYTLETAKFTSTKKMMVLK